MFGGRRRLLAGFGRCAGEELERLVDENNGERELENGHPLDGVQRTNLKDDVEDVHVEDHEVEGHRDADGQDQVNVLPRRHADHRLVLRHAVQGVEHFDDDQNGERHRHGLGISEDGLAVDALEHGVVSFVAVEVVGQLVVGQLGTAVGDHVPPGGCSDRRGSDVQPNDHVSEKQPGSDERFLGGPRLFLHDIQVGRIESQSGGRETVGDQVDPEQLDRDQGFRETQGGRQEDADDLADVGGDEIADELLHVVVDGAALLHSGNDGSEVVVCGKIGREV